MIIDLCGPKNPNIAKIVRCEFVMIVYWFSWGGNLVSGPRFEQARLPRGVHWVFTNVSHDLCGPKNQPATLCALYEQIFERTRFSLIVNSENSWAGLVPRRVWSVNLSLSRRVLYQLSYRPYASPRKSCMSISEQSCYYLVSAYQYTQYMCY